ncbi:MAG TPA: hypothetical protein PLL09_02890 [Flavobacterium sp.]|uniref:hypothetical protein n=2 Tax=Flavobacterium TaxID=237 RepID=UPI0025C62B8F|nr:MULTISPECIES: hypothetical protein [unclassified Flavobacterium]HRE76752.1 hypothetical protein [Flavobacterium sp.]
MNYCQHTDLIKLSFPELDLVKESEFYIFNNEDFAVKLINQCIDFCENIQSKININIHFSVQYSHIFNAKAIVKKNNGVIIFNSGLIDKLETIVLDCIEIFSYENIAILTMNKEEKKDLIILFSEFCISYLFYHEFAHIMQMLDSTDQKNQHLQEEYSDVNSFNIKNHVYELDADHFGVSMSTTDLLTYIWNKQYPINPVLLFNLITISLFTISSLIIEFSGKDFKTIYYKRKSHPHPLIRIIECTEQILFFISQNFKIDEVFFQATLQRNIKIIDQINYSSCRAVGYSNLLEYKIHEIEKYINEIEENNNSFKELIRFRSQELSNILLS